MSDELKPCPFCGGRAVFDHDDSGWNWIVCQSCGASTDQMVSIMDDCKPLLAEKWNKRTPMPTDNPVEPVASLLLANTSDADGCYTAFHRKEDFDHACRLITAQLEAEKRRAVNEALDLLDILFSAYEDGLPCEEVDGGYIGNAVDLDEETFDKIADLLNRERPRVLKEKPND